jgi:hypothetical protein
MRKLDSVNGSLIRENQSLFNNIEMFKKNTEELMNENNVLKDSLDKYEVSYADLDLVLQQLQSDNTQLKTDVKRVKRNRTISREKSRPRNYNDSPERDIHRSHIEHQARPDIGRVSDVSEIYPPKEVKFASSQFAHPQAINTTDGSDFKNQGPRSLFRQYIESNQTKNSNLENQKDHRESRFNPTQSRENIPDRVENKVRYEHQSAEREKYAYLTPEKDRRSNKNLNTSSKFKYI